MTARTSDELRALEKDAFAALQDAIQTGRIRMSVPADPERDTDLRIDAALTALRSAANTLAAVQAYRNMLADTDQDAKWSPAVIVADLNHILNGTAEQEDAPAPRPWTQPVDDPTTCWCGKWHQHPEQEDAR